MINTYEPDFCCGDALSEALRSGALDDTDVWTHEKCGVIWRATRTDAEPPLEVWVRHWTPHEHIEVFKP